MKAIEHAGISTTSRAFDESRLSLAERTQQELRLAVAAVEKNLCDLTAAPSPSADEQSRTLDELRASWRTVVDALALEPEPERRACVFCRGPMRLNATRCLYCWKKSSPA